MCIPGLRGISTYIWKRRFLVIFLSAHFKMHSFCYCAIVNFWSRTMIRSKLPTSPLLIWHPVSCYICPHNNTFIPALIKSQTAIIQKLWKLLWSLSRTQHNWIILVELPITTLFLWLNIPLQKVERNCVLELLLLLILEKCLPYSFSSS